VSLLTERIGDRLSYHDDVNPKSDWPRYTCTPKEAEIFTTGKAQRKIQKLEGEMSALLANIQGNKSFPSCRYWPSEPCLLGTKCCLKFYHDPKRTARTVRQREESDTAERNAPGTGNPGLSHSAPPPCVMSTPLCRYATIDKEMRCVTQTTHHTIQEDTVAEGGAAAMARLRFVQETGAAQDMAERNLAAEWAVLTTGSAMDNKRVPGFVPPPLPPTPSLYCLHELVGHKLKTNKPQSEIDSNTEGAWTTIRRTTTTRQTHARDNKSFDTGKLMVAVNMYTCLIKEDQIEKDRKR